MEENTNIDEHNINKRQIVLQHKSHLKIHENLQTQF